MGSGRFRGSAVGSASSSDPPRPTLWAGCLLLSFLSGFVALVYELLWTRRFATIFGATAPAASVTISALFLGLGLGSSVLGSRSNRWRRPLRAYGLVEIGVGLSALLTMSLLHVYETSYPLVHGHLAGYPATAVAVKAGYAVLALLVPSFLMGSSLAFLAQVCIRSRQTTGATGSVLYGANTLGATLGACSVPFFWLPWLGVQGGYWAAVLWSLTAGALAIVLDFLRPQPAFGGGFNATSSPAAATWRKGSAASRPKPKWLLADLLPTLAFLSGFLTLGLEVLWMRMLAQVHENSIYSFAIVLSVFLIGLSAGAFLARAGLARRLDPESSLALAWLSGGWLVSLSPVLFYWLSGGLAYAGESGPPGLVTLGLAVATMLLPTVLAGTILPLILHLMAEARPRAPGPLIGRLLALNTAGAAIGPLVVTYLGFPLLGLWCGIGMVGLLMAGLGESVSSLVCAPRPGVRRVVALTLFGSLILFLDPFALPRVKIDRGKGERVLHVEEGSHGIVAVVENSFSRWMILNNFYTLGGTGSAIEERQQAQIPLLLHDSPRNIAFLGMGTGISAGGALLPPVQKLVVSEMVPEVIRAADDYFDHANQGLLRDPRVKVIREDARIHLLATTEKFDVIVGDLVVPWRSGESALFTKEHFETVRASLAPGGLFCQWLPMFQLSERQFQIVAATFLDTFPRTTLWRGDLFPNIPALALVGHTAVEPLDPDAVDARIDSLHDSLAGGSPILAAPGGLWIFLVGALRGGDPDFANAPRNRENQPWIELLSPSPGLWGADGTTKFVGEPLYRFMEKTRLASLAGSPLENLDQRHIQWRDAGAKLWFASLTLHQGNQVLANRIAAESLALVPPQLRIVINGE